MPSEDAGSADGSPETAPEAPAASQPQSPQLEQPRPQHPPRPKLIKSLRRFNMRPDLPLIITDVDTRSSNGVLDESPLPSRTTTPLNGAGPAARLPSLRPSTNGSDGPAKLGMPGEHAMFLFDRLSPQKSDAGRHRSYSSSLDSMTSSQLDRFSDVWTDVNRENKENRNASRAASKTSAKASSWATASTHARSPDDMEEVIRRATRQTKPPVLLDAKDIRLGDLLACANDALRHMMEDYPAVNGLLSEPLQGPLAHYGPVGNLVHLLYRAAQRERILAPALQRHRGMVHQSTEAAALQAHIADIADAVSPANSAQSLLAAPVIHHTKPGSRHIDAEPNGSVMEDAIRGTTGGAEPDFEDSIWDAIERSETADARQSRNTSYGPGWEALAKRYSTMKKHFPSIDTTTAATVDATDRPSSPPPAGAVAWQNKSDFDQPSQVRLTTITEDDKEYVPVPLSLGIAKKPAPVELDAKQADIVLGPVKEALEEAEDDIVWLGHEYDRLYSTYDDVVAENALLQKQLDSAVRDRGHLEVVVNRSAYKAELNAHLQRLKAASADADANTQATSSDDLIELAADAADEDRSEDKSGDEHEAFAPEAGEVIGSWWNVEDGQEWEDFDDVSDDEELIIGAQGLEKHVEEAAPEDKGKAAGVLQSPARQHRGTALQPPQTPSASNPSGILRAAKVLGTPASRQGGRMRRTCQACASCGCSAQPARNLRNHFDASPRRNRAPMTPRTSLAIMASISLRSGAAKTSRVGLRPRTPASPSPLGNATSRPRQSPFEKPVPGPPGSPSLDPSPPGLRTPRLSMVLESPVTPTTLKSVIKHPSAGPEGSQAQGSAHAHNPQRQPIPKSPSGSLLSSTSYTPTGLAHSGSPWGSSRLPDATGLGGMWKKSLLSLGHSSSRGSPYPANIFRASDIAETMESRKAARARRAARGFVQFDAETPSDETTDKKVSPASLRGFGTPTSAANKKLASPVATAIPALEIIPASRSIPALEVIPASGSIPGSTNIPALQIIPASGSIPGSANIPALEIVSVSGSIPGSENIPALVLIPASGSIPGSENIPALETIPALEISPALEDSPSSSHHEARRGSVQLALGILNNAPPSGPGQPTPMQPPAATSRSLYLEKSQPALGSGFFGVLLGILLSVPMWLLRQRKNTHAVINWCLLVYLAPKLDGWYRVVVRLFGHLRSQLRHKWTSGSAATADPDQQHHDAAYHDPPPPYTPRSPVTAVPDGPPSAAATPSRHTPLPRSPQKPALPSGNASDQASKPKEMPPFPLDALAELAVFAGLLVTAFVLSLAIAERNLWLDSNADLPRHYLYTYIMQYDRDTGSCSTNPYIFSSFFREPYSSRPPATHSPYHMCVCLPTFFDARIALEPMGYSWLYISDWFWDSVHLFWRSR